MNVQAAAIYEAVVDWGVTGLTGTLGLRVLDNAGNTTVARLTTNVAETPAGSGVYSRTGNVAPSTLGQYTLLWDDGSVTPGHVATEDLLVGAGMPGSVPVADPALSPVCENWIGAEDVADCCGVTAGSDNQEALEAAALAAVAILFQLTGRRYTGTCERTVRPVGPDFCWAPRLSRRDRHLLSRVKLAGYVTAIIEVLIGPDVVDPAGYRIDDHRYLTRMADSQGRPQRWPVNPRLDLPPGADGTFLVSYRHGLAPPLAGVAAASALACELYKACPAPGDSGLGECKLPAGAKRIVRQGVTVELVSALASMLKTGATGLTAVDAFLAVYATTSRKAAIWSPDIRPFARPEGISSGGS